MTKNIKALRLITILCILFSISSISPMSVNADTFILRVIPNGSTSIDCGTTWENACDLQYALLTRTDTIGTSWELWVKGGTYYPSTTNIDLRKATFRIKRDVALLGGFSGNETTREGRNWRTNLTILSGDIDKNDLANPATSYNQIVGNNVYHVVTGNSLPSTPNWTSNFDGITITGGKANGPGWDDFGGGYFNNFNQNLIMTNVTICGNLAAHGGGIANFSLLLSLNNVIISGNYALYSGGGIDNSSGLLNLSNVVFQNNISEDSGGGLNTNGAPIISNTTFLNNSSYDGGGVRISGRGVFYSDPNPMLTNITFIGNKASFWGGGMYSDNSSPILTNITFTENTATNNGGAIYYSGGSSTMRNSILWKNSPNQLIADGLFVEYSDIQGGYAGTGNITANPLLGILGDYGGSTPTIQLLLGSPAIDTANLANCPTTDQRGVTRPQGKGCDMGAYEFYKPVFYIPIICK